MKPTVVIHWVEKVFIYTDNSTNKNYNRNELTVFIISIFLSNMYFSYTFAV